MSECCLKGVYKSGGILVIPVHLFMVACEPVSGGGRESIRSVQLLLCEWALE